MTRYTNYEKAVLQTLWTWAKQYHQGELDKKPHKPPVLACRFATNNVLIPRNISKADTIRIAIPQDQRQLWFRSLKSSQALTQSVFGALSAFNRLDLLRDVQAECGRPAFFGNHRGWKLDFEHEVRCLGENPRGRTSVDVLLSEPNGRVAVECKFTEQEFGTCSRPRLRPSDPNYSEQHCNGNYQVQRQRRHRCSLTEVGIRYWDHLPYLFDWPADCDHEPCPFGGVYQLARNALAAALTPKGKLDPNAGHGLVVYDARNPEFQAGGKAESQWVTVSAACRVPGLVRRLSWQSLLAAIARASELAYLVDGVREKYGLEP